MLFILIFLNSVDVEVCAGCDSNLKPILHSEKKLGVDVLLGSYIAVFVLLVLVHSFNL